MRFVINLCFLLGAVCFFTAYLPEENLWQNMFHELISIGVVFYLLTISLLAFEVKAYHIEIFAVLFAVCQFMQFLDEIRGVQWEIHLLEILIPFFVIIFLFYSHWKRLKRK